MTITDEQDSKKSTINYIDIILAVLNSLNIILPLIIFHDILGLSIIGILISIVILALTIYTFIRNNPLYTYYSDILLLGGLLYSFMSPLFFLFFIDFCYLCYRINVHVKYSKRNRNKPLLARGIGRYYVNNRNINIGIGKEFQQWDNIQRALENKRIQYREKLENQYHYKIILASSVMFALVLIVVFALLAINLRP